MFRRFGNAKPTLAQGAGKKTAMQVAAALRQRVMQMDSKVQADLDTYCSDRPTCPSRCGELARELTVTVRAPQSLAWCLHQSLAWCLQPEMDFTIGTGSRKKGRTKGRYSSIVRTVHALSFSELLEQTAPKLAARGSPGSLPTPEQKRARAGEQRQVVPATRCPVPTWCMMAEIDAEIVGDDKFADIEAVMAQAESIVEERKKREEEVLRVKAEEEAGR
eukprot:1914383-Rhodomonas_salina.2